MREHGFQKHMFCRLDHVGEGADLGECQSQARHASVDFQMNGYCRRRVSCLMEFARGIFEEFNVAPIPHRWCEIVLDDGLLLAMPKAGHQQDVSANSVVAEQNALIGRTHAEPRTADLLQGTRAFDRTMTVGVGFYDGADSRLRLNVIGNGAKVVLKSSKRDFRPGWTHGPVRGL